MSSDVPSFPPTRGEGQEAEAEPACPLKRVRKAGLHLPLTVGGEGEECGLDRRERADWRALHSLSIEPVMSSRQSSISY